MPRSLQTARAACTLAFAAGAVDAIGYLTLARLFTAHMSGNSVALAAALGRADVGTVIERGVPIAVFAAGVVAGTIIVQLEQTRRVRHPFAAVYGAEVALLIAFWALAATVAPTGSIEPTAGWPFYALAALLSLTMGLQNATLGRIDGLAVHTTYVSSVLTGLATTLAQVIMPTARSGRLAGEYATIYAGLWGGYLAGASGASLVLQGRGLAALVLPLAALGLVLVLDVRHPHELGADSA